MLNTRIVSAFPGVGKSHLHNEFVQTGITESLDSDSTYWSWIRRSHSKEVRHPNFPFNYIDHIEACKGLFDFIFVSSHDVVRDELYIRNLEFDLVYPKMELKEEYIQRYGERGSPPAFVKLLGKQWENWITELEEYHKINVNHIRLDSGQYLAHVL